MQGECKLGLAREEFDSIPPQTHRTSRRCVDPPLWVDFVEYRTTPLKCRQQQSRAKQRRIKLNAVLPAVGLSCNTNSSRPTFRRTSALVTEWSQNCGHFDKLSC